MTYEEKKIAIYELMKIKDSCGYDLICPKEHKCDFKTKYGTCGFYGHTPKHWTIPKFTHWTPEDVALARELKKHGVTHVNRGTDYAFWHDKKNNAFGLLPGKPFLGLNPNDDLTPIDTIISEAEEG